MAMLSSRFYGAVVSAWGALVCCAVPATALHAQAGAAAQVAPIDQVTAAELQTQSAALLKQAQSSAAGIASVTLKKYPGHLTMLTVRTRSGGAEMHEHFSDFFFVLGGEATELTGGTIPNSKESAPGEIRGAAVAGGVPHVMRAGDIIHIAPGTPHQTLVAPGQTFTYYVIKVEQP